MFAVVIVLYSTIPAVALSAMPVESTPAGAMTPLGEEYKTDPLVGIVHAFPDGLLKKVWLAWIGLLAGTILTIASNAGIIGISRLTFSLSHHDLLPKRLAKLHPRFKTPYLATVIFGAVAILAILPGKIDQLAALYAFSAMMSFTIAHVSILKLRLSQPERERPFRIKLNLPWRGSRLPITTIIGGMCTATAWTVIVCTDFANEVLGIAWVAIGIAVYVVYTRGRRKVIMAGARPGPPPGRSL